MKKTSKASAWRTLGAAIMAMWLAGAPGRAAETAGVAENDPAARFRGPPIYDFGITNIKWEAATPDYSYVTFDLSWSFSWRAKWIEPGTNTVTGKDLEVENWDAAWVFVKFLPDRDSKESLERNHWLHATLDTNAANHVMPAGATNTVGLSKTIVDAASSSRSDARGGGAASTSDGSRGMGVFIYRDKVGHGVNDFKGVKLRWLHSKDRVDPAKAAIKVHPIAMVYVPEGPFKLGSGQLTRIDRFPDGPTLPILQGHVGDELGSFTDGSWRGGPIVPFLVDAAWNGPVAQGTAARRIGAVAGQLWGRVGYTTHCSHYWWMPDPTSIGAPGALNDDYPTGYNAFYCMKYELTQGQYAAYLNSLPRELAAARAQVPGGEIRADVWTNHPWETAGYTITVPGRLKLLSMPKGPAEGSAEEMAPDVEKAMEAFTGPAPKQFNLPPVYAARLPHRTCNFLHWQDGFAYAVWSGLRPMTELEFEKVCRGPINPVPGEHAWGSTAMIVATNLLDAGLPTERYDHGNCHSLYWRDSGAMATRAGIFATPASDRVTSGASYWGILEMEIAHFAIPVGTTNGRAFRGSHGDGRVPSGAIPGPAVPSDWPTPGGRMGLVMSHRTTANTPSDRPPTYPRSGGDRSHCSCWRGVRSAAPRPAGPKPAASPATPVPGAEPATAAADMIHDNVRITNVKWETGAKDSGDLTFDISWDNSWRASWTEPAEKNVTGKPLRVESWDAAWVFVKFLAATDAQSNFWRHATLDADDSRHQVPAGAVLDVGLNDQGDKGLGVFIYRAAAGSGPVAFKNVRLRWRCGVDNAPDSGTQLRVHAIPMVYVPQSPFQSKGPWGHPLSLIDNGDATKPGGYRVGQAPAVHESQKKRRVEFGPAPKSVAWPNGYGAFYCMKYSISQGQYADFLNSLPAARAAEGCSSRYNLNRFTIRRSADKGGYTADAPDRACNYLNWRHIWAYTAWTGLRPITDLEYEKACRGPRAVARDADAWGAAACAPFDSASASAQGATAGKQGGPAAASGASYWGIRELSLSGVPFEWPQVVSNEPGYDFKGTHGEGGPDWPADWPAEGPLGGIYEDDFGWGFMIGFWIDPADMGRIQEAMGCEPNDRTGRYGARAARTAPFRQEANAPLQVNPVPSLIGYDVGVFYLAGLFRNDADKPLRVELATTLPAACFPDGAASRAFVAAPKAATPFKILTVLTRHTAAAAVRADRTLPVRIQAAGDKVLAELSVPFLVSDPQEIKLPVIGSLDGGEVPLRFLNTTERPVTVTIEMPAPAGLMMDSAPRRVEVAAGRETRTAYAVPRQGFDADGVIRVPYRIAVASGLSAVPAQAGAMQNGETAIERRTVTRWWVFRGIQGPSRPGAPSAHFDADSSDSKLDKTMLASIVSNPNNVFLSETPPPHWEVAVFGAEIPLGRRGPLPPLSAPAMAATQVFSPRERDVIIRVQHKLSLMNDPQRLPRFVVRVRISGRMAYDSRPDANTADADRNRPVHLSKGRNTVLVECQSQEGVPADPGILSLQFIDAQDGREVKDLTFDIGDRQARK